MGTFSCFLCVRVIPLVAIKRKKKKEGKGMAEANVYNIISKNWRQYARPSFLFGSTTDSSGMAARACKNPTGITRL